MVHSIADALIQHAAEQPDKLCIVDEKREYTYGEIAQLAVKCAAALRVREIAKDDYIVVECKQDARFLICAFACQLSGVMFVPVENKAAAERTTEMLFETKAKLFLYENRIETAVSAESIETFFEAVEQEDAVIAAAELARLCSTEGSGTVAEDACEVLYTTGTTGKPRGIILTNENNVAIAENVKYGTQMKEDSVELMPLPLSHSHGLRTCYADILNGSTIVIVNGVMNVRRIFELIERYHITALDLSPNAAKVLLKLSKGSFAKYAQQIDFIQIGTAMLDEALKEELCRTFPESRLYNFYGSTESGRVCVLDFNAERGKPGCIGRPAKHASFIVTDEERREIASNRENIGLIAIAGKMNMKGYMGLEELTREAMHDGYVYTNDAGYIDENGDVYVLGRNDDVINYKGIKIVPEDIEAWVLKFDGVRDCACVAVPDALCGQAPKVFVAVEDAGHFDTAELLIYLSEVLEANRLPKQAEVIDEIPRTSNGKILRRKLRE